MSNISMLDCTLRDGGWVNNFCFGTDIMRKILHTIENSGIEYVELGYLDAEKGSSCERSEYLSTDAIDDTLLREKKNLTYLVMIDYGKYPMGRLPKCSETGIDGIRLCFHKKDMNPAIAMGRMILEKGYRLWMQPMVCTYYTDAEFVHLVSEIQKELKGVSGFYIVDSFGSMRQDDVIRRMRIADGILDKDIALGLHTHNNMQLSFHNALAAIELGMNRDLMIDATLDGIGKGAGNICTEEFSEYLNRSRGKMYNVAILKRVAEEVIREMKPKYSWEYREAYYLSAKYNLTPSYAKIFCEKPELKIEDIEILLANVPEENRNSFNSDVAEELINKFINSKRESEKI